jgi:hypothetical protein
MAEPVGQWHINANGFKGTMDINGDGQGNLTGTVNIDIGFTDQLQGVWNEAAQEIVFNRIIIRNGNTIIQTYTGSLFATKEPIFQGQGPPEPNPDFLLLTGSFDGIGSGAVNGRGFFGWAARQHI